MPFVLIIIGLVLLVAAVRNSQDNLFALVQKDVTGQGNFLYWIASIGIIGAIGYVPKLKPISTALLGLIILVLFISKGGFFEQFTTQLASTTTAPGPGTNAPSPATPGGNSTGMPGNSPAVGNWEPNPALNPGQNLQNYLQTLKTQGGIQ